MKPTSKEVIDELCKILDATPKEIKGFMTPKEKAEELIETFWTQVRDYRLQDPSMSKTQAKECALIAVDMVIKCCEEYDEVHETHTTQVDYWREVKQEIYNL